MTKVTAAALGGHPFLHGMPSGQLEFLAGHTRLASVPARHRFFEVGGTAQHFLLIRAGQAALDVLVPGQGRVVVEAIGRGEVVGVSWFFAPYRWQFGAVALQPTEVFEVAAQPVRQRCEEDPDFGYQFTKRLITVVARRLQGTRVRMLQLCGEPATAGMLLGLAAAADRPPGRRSPRRRPRRGYGVVARMRRPVMTTGVNRM